MPFRSSGNTVFSGPSAYSRDSTPDSGASHYMDSYRSVNGKLSSYLILLFIRSTENNLKW